MKAFERLTKRIYNTEPLLAQYDSFVTKVGKNYIELDSTVAYPEGGGQEADHGVLSTPSVQVKFNDVKKVYTNPVTLNNFPSIDSNGVIWHYIEESDQDKLSQFAVGDPVTIALDIERRAKLSISHTASHILYMAIEQCRPGVVDHIFGCHIKTEGARFDFYTEKFVEAHIQSIEAVCNQLLAENHPIATTLHDENNDAKYWTCNGFVIPCGGTHINHTGLIQTMRIRRKGLGAGKERIMCTFEANVAQQVQLMQTHCP
jgi:Ser-tRNA(Ala) deacylase AlaX